MEALLEGEAERLTRRAIQAALGGDTTALKLCLDRIAPAPRERMLCLDAPPVNSPADVPAAMSAVVAAVTSGGLTLGEAAAMVALLDRYRVAFKTAESDRQFDDLMDFAGCRP